jgi:outer membrane protein OmpA-like peptidoglycan-associated protein
MYERGKVSLQPQLLVSVTSGRIFYNAGFITSYELQSYKKKPSDRIDLITKYRSNDGPVLGVQLQKEAFGVGLSYEFPVLGNKVSNHGALEVGVSIRRLVDPRRGNPRKKVQAKKPATNTRAAVVAKPTAVKKDSTSAGTPKPTKPSLSERLKLKQDSVVAIGIPGEFTHEPLVLEKATLRFNFHFNSSEINDEANEYLDQVAQALNDNPELKVQLTGHTDNVGSAKFNLKLSIERAHTIKEFLVDRGVNEERIEVSGKGLMEPLNENKTEEERALNRRVEMKIVYVD